jgi:hypothetical protein
LKFVLDTNVILKALIKDSVHWFIAPPPGTYSHVELWVVGGLNWSRQRFLIIDCSSASTTSTVMSFEASIVFPTCLYEETTGPVDDAARYPI